MSTGSYASLARLAGRTIAARWEAVLGRQRVGVYANSKTIEWALQDGLASYFWQHNWGSPGRVAHQAAHLHQVEIDQRSVAGVGVDMNHILKPRYGQWD